MGLHSSIGQSTAALTQRPWVRFPLKSPIFFFRDNLQLLKLQLPLRRSYLHLILCIYSQCSTGNQFPVQVTSCVLSSREPVGGFSFSILPDRTVFWIWATLRFIPMLSRWPTNPLRIVPSAPTTISTTLLLTLHSFQFSCQVLIFTNFLFLLQFHPSIFWHSYVNNLANCLLYVYYKVRSIYLFILFILFLQFLADT